MSKIVVKFGGTSVANIERILNAAKLIKSKVDEGHKVVVVVSAMSGVTNDLIKKSKEIIYISNLETDVTHKQYKEDSSLCSE